MRLRFWFMSALKMLGLIVGASAAYGLLLWLQMDDGSMAFLAMLQLYFILFGAFMLLVMNVSLYKMMVSLVLSFGSTRREAFTGLQIYRLLPGLAATALTVLLAVIPGVEPLFSPSATAAICLGAFLLCGAIGSILGMVNYRFGKVGAIVAGVCVAIVCMGGGFLFGFAAVGQTRFPPLLRSSWYFPWIFLIFSAVVYALVLIPERRIIRRYQVKQ